MVSTSHYYGGEEVWMEEMGDIMFIESMENRGEI